MNIIEIKTLQRSITLSLEDRRRQLEKKRSLLDQLQLNLENLQYKEAFLNREIRSCKDIATPHTLEIEKELQIKLGTTVFSDNLEAINLDTKVILDQEKADRIKTQEVLENLLTEDRKTLELLDRKRKFVDDLPGKVDAVKEAISDLQNHFTSVLDSFQT